MFGSAPKTKPMPREQIIDWLRLIRSSNVGPTTFRQLINRFGGARAALEALPELTRRGGAKTSPRITSREQAEEELDQLQAMGGRMVGIGEPDYPFLLQFIHAPPPLLAMMGSLPRNDGRTIGIVGARNASASGQKLTASIAGELGEHGITVVSGLARGIDAAAHTAALPTGTIAVYAGGLDKTYPAENIPLARDILKNNGLLVSEMPLGTVPRARDFPRRNRLVSGMSRGVLVIEAALRSGSLITARLALEQDRDVFAVPGSPMDPRAAGTNRLIRNGAILVTGAGDILEEFSRLSPAPDLFARDGQDLFADQDAPLPPLHQVSPSDRQKVQDALSTTPTPVDDLVAATSLEAPVVQSILLELDLAGRIERSAGQLVALV